MCYNHGKSLSLQFDEFFVRRTGYFVNRGHSQQILPAKHCQTDIFKGSFASRVYKFWNALPEFIGNCRLVEANNTATFKRDLESVNLDQLLLTII